MIADAVEQHSAVGRRESLVVKPREARVVVTRILRQAAWDWGLEPAVGSMVLAAQLIRLDGLGVLDRDWDEIRSTDPAGISVSRAGAEGWRLDVGGCHPLVSAPSILDHLLMADAFHRITVSVGGCFLPELLGAVCFFGPRYGLTITLSTLDDRPVLTAIRAPTGEAPQAISPLQASDYVVDRATWDRLLCRSQAYLIPESEVSRGHAGDGTGIFPAVTPPAQSPDWSK